MIPTKAELTELYVKQSLSTTQIAKMYGTSQPFVCRWLREAGIPARTKGWHKGVFRLPGSTSTQNPVTAKCPKGGGHYWIIEIPDGPTSKAECKKCHGMKEFRNGDGEARPTDTRNVHKSQGDEVFLRYVKR